MNHFPYQFKDIYSSFTQSHVFLRVPSSDSSRVPTWVILFLRTIRITCNIYIYFYRDKVYFEISVNIADRYCFTIHGLSGESSLTQWRHWQSRGVASLCRSYTVTGVYDCDYVCQPRMSAIVWVRYLCSSFEMNSFI